MFQKILIANRGEIACRVAATARRMGVKTVAVYSDADAHARHVAACDEALHIGGSAPGESYLRAQRIIEAAQATGAQAIHPGYGFLSENAGFAQACADAGLVFIGPPPSAIRDMGFKAGSKQRMEKAGVPLVPGYHGADQDPALLRAEADRIGYPVLIKASAGGGGKGMRTVDRAQDFAAALDACRREARNSFGDDAVLIEKYLQRPRHIEIQVFGDSHGNCVHLFERDCSVQRRYQKLLEEAPAPGMAPELRARMGQAAVAAARAVNYVGAGTVEFIAEQRADGTLDFFFMEMNTRLQVEHPVTEAITGQDLVEWQLRVACGEPLPLTQEQLRINGHAIEARICAENPEKDFLPATGTLAVCGLPEGTAFEHGAVRVDSGVRQGDAISPFYDPLLAKLIVHGATRAQALARLDEALARTHIVGLDSNVQFLRRLARSDSFASARLDTTLIAREQAALFQREDLGLPLAAAAAVAQTLLRERASEGADPFSRRDGFCSHGLLRRRFEFAFGDARATAWLTYGRGANWHLTVGEGAAQQAGPLVFGPAAQGIDLQFAGLRTHAAVYTQGEVEHVFTPLGATRIVAIDLLAHAGEVEAPAGRLTAPMPGKLLSFAVRAGDKVRQGQPLAVLEAMKMEHLIVAPLDGVVQELLYAPGDQVSEGAELLRLSAEPRITPHMMDK
ncbi:acetyl/propionyl/methylcrotonyl-CoA carboxylase subunit alpha [Verminephrobacter aporrectodeae subsp. tuberculatae]|uniref:acetyl-CoA carboxylase biotin carboxylase subunit n=1 Tax=Verminephrobacter aporrectodeae TaxID=1110389 RepID=UPI00223790CC|nr:acetyl/propionyl/methylcrotonyl-CoA carboxylase subunit alpha [Verminephrobacter aporrectodeae]MCW5220237.1 acetyl/propionyl/methylcrotonyl-CoA carboxylase subunit alpha [Verminephrobacter aporrectodeae subsp. tuberculatae]MCW5289530.1 acetyl/propionyl/methylcrotonyl-CoA carboxylase subunit alpha [Verminephrobacter aporrectodeae subsp. tuberculatae]